MTKQISDADLVCALFALEDRIVNNPKHYPVNDRLEHLQALKRLNKSLKHKVFSEQYLDIIEDQLITGII